MMLSIACISSDIEYATRMISYMKSNPIYRTWKMQLFTSLQKFIGTPIVQTLDVVLYDEYFVEQHGSDAGQNFDLIKSKVSANEALVIKLGSQFSSKEQELQLLKYIPLSRLLHDIQTLVDHYKAIPVRKQLDGTTIISVGSSLPYCGKTIFALHLSQILASRNQKVFYMNVETWNTSMQWISSQDQFDGSYSEFLYVLKSNAQEVSQWLKSHIHYDAKLQIEYLKPFIHREDRMNLSQQDVEAMVQAIVQMKQFDYIVLDLDAGYHQWNYNLVSQSHFHFMMLLGSEQWLGKHEKYMQYLKQCDEPTEVDLNQRAIKVAVGDLNHTGLHQYIKSDIKLPVIEQWHSKVFPILSSPSYRAIVEHSIQSHLLQHCKESIC